MAAVHIGIKLPKAEVGWSALLRVREILRSHLGSEIRNPEGLRGFSQSLPANVGAVHN
jgi:hypothetical protein